MSPRLTLGSFNYATARGQRRRRACEILGKKRHVKLSSACPMGESQKSLSERRTLEPGIVGSLLALAELLRVVRMDDKEGERKAKRGRGQRENEVSSSIKSKHL